MTNEEQKIAAQKFSEKWAGKGSENGQKQGFWLELLRSVYGVQDPEEYIDFEKPVKIDGSACRIDGHIPTTRVVIEQKTLGTRLDLKSKECGIVNVSWHFATKHFIPYNQQIFITANQEMKNYDPTPDMNDLAKAVYEIYVDLLDHYDVIAYDEQ